MCNTPAVDESNAATAGHEKERFRDCYLPGRLYKGVPPMFTPSPAQPSANLPKVLLGSSSLLLISSLVFNFLNSNKVGSLRTELRAMMSGREIAERARVASEKNLKTLESALGAAESKAMAAEAKVHAAETELSKTEEEKAQIESSLQTSEAQVADLEKRVAEATINQGAGGAGDASSDQLKSAL